MNTSKIDNAIASLPGDGGFGGEAKDKRIIKDTIIPTEATIYNDSLSEMRFQIAMAERLGWMIIGEATFIEHPITGKVMYLQKITHRGKKATE